MKISIFGLGFVGLTTALGLADKGFEVWGYDVDASRGAVVPFYEPGLPEAMKRTLGKTYHVAKDPAEAAYGCDVLFLCVGTPGLPDGTADLTYVFNVIDSVKDVVSEGCVFVIKSTIPPSSCERVAAQYPELCFAVNPEFLREGYSWEDFMNPDRIVCGVSCDVAKNALTRLYAPFNAPIHFVSPNTAEFIKYLSNSMLATMISYANEMSLLADAVGGIDIAKAFRVLHEDKRLAGSGIASYIYPGCGYGGYCLPKDTEALEALGRSKGFEAGILQNVISLNENMPRISAEKIIKATQGKSDKIGILGLSFKPGSDDVRDSSAAKIIAELISAGYTNIWGFDPMANEEFEKHYNLGISYAKSAGELCTCCDTIALVTAWKDFADINNSFNEKTFVDLRYFLEDDNKGV